jgi:hypothetical protein
MEKTFPIFSVRNTLVNDLTALDVSHFLGPFLKNRRKRKTFYYLRNYPRATARITLKD